MTLLLTRRDVAELLDLDECIAAVERAFRLHAEGRTLPPGVLGIPAGEGAFHIKAAGLGGYFAAKTNGNFSGNPARFGLPAIQGVVALFDAEKGSPLALMDSIEITILRTGAATAVAARYLARPDARVATIFGCGNQGRVQLRALTRVLPLTRAYAFDADPARAARFAAEMSAELGIEVAAVADLAAAVKASDVCVTCTPSRRAFLGRADVAPGTFVAAVGADNEDKQELEPALVASSTLVVDVLEQAATIGELHHALDAGLMTRAEVHAELGEVVAGRKPGRASRDAVTIFDSTGTALQDVAAAVAVYEKARVAGRGLTLDLAS
jgi:alanine dehydrogenase